LPYTEVVSRPRTRASAFRTQRAVAPSCHSRCATVARRTGCLVPCAASGAVRQQSRSAAHSIRGSPAQPETALKAVKGIDLIGDPTYYGASQVSACRHLARERRGRRRRLGFGAGRRGLLYRRRRWLQVLPNPLQGIGGQKIGDREVSGQAHFSTRGRLAGRRARLV